MLGLAFDTWEYAQTLQHIGEPLKIDSLPWPLLVRPIPETDYFDALSPWPYVSHCSPLVMANTLEILKEKPLVSLTVLLSPDTPPSLRGWMELGINISSLKPHFVLPKGDLPPHWSKKTRANINRARRHWQVKEISLNTYGEIIGEWYQRIALQRNFSPIAYVNSDHFLDLAKAPGFTVLGAFYTHTLGAALVVAETNCAIHFHAIVGDEESKRQGGAYALYDQAVSRWQSTHTLYMGGQPGHNGEGVARFKKRFTTTESPVWIVKEILNPEIYELLTTQKKGNPRFFPAYRYPNLS